MRNKKILIDQLTKVEKCLIINLDIFINSMNYFTFV